MYLFAILILTFCYFDALRATKLKLSENPVAQVPYEGHILPIYVDADSYKSSDFSNAIFYVKPLAKIIASTAHCIYQRLPARFTVEVTITVWCPIVQRTAQLYLQEKFLNGSLIPVDNIKPYPIKQIRPLIVDDVEFPDGVQLYPNYTVAFVEQERRIKMKVNMKDTFLWQEDSQCIVKGKKFQFSTFDNETCQNFKELLVEDEFTEAITNQCRSINRANRNDCLACGPKEGCLIVIHEHRNR